MEKIMVTRPSMPSYNEYTKEIFDIWNSRQLTSIGPKHKQFEYDLERFLNVENLTIFVNGHMALELGLQILNLQGEVITTPFTYASTTHAIVRSALKPVFCDIDPSTYCIDVKKIEQLITKETSAILPVHVYGHICNIEEIEDIAKKNNLMVIYDAAHSFGQKYKNIDIGNFGDMSMFSFQATKVFNTIEGGALCYNNSELKNKLEKVKNFGISDEDSVDYVGCNAKMNEFAAAMGICNLRHVKEEIEKRKYVVKRYRKNLKNISGIILPPIQENVLNNYAYFPVVFDEVRFGTTRNHVYEFLKTKEIYTRKYFYPLTNLFNCFNNIYDINDTPIAVHISERVLTLPLYADLDLNDVDRICDAILSLSC